MKQFLIYLTIFSLLIVSVISQNCTFTDSKGDTFDLSPLILTGANAFYSFDEGDNKLWYVNICADFSGTPCTTPGAACQYGTSTAGVLPGNFTDLDTASIGVTEKGVNLTYFNGQACKTRPRQTSVYLICNTSTDALITEVQEPTDPEHTCMYYIYFQTKYACPSGSSGIEGGWIFIIILIVVVLLYLAIGVVYQWKRNHATGLELIPNHEFWRDVPGLFKDGCMYTFRKVTCKQDYQAL